METKTNIVFLNEFGIIFHFGLYAVPAFDDPKLIVKRKIQNGSEWYKKRLEENGIFRPVSGWKETQTYHKLNYKSKKYEDFTKDFTLKNLDTDKWMELCKSVGATYVIITAKHHDGFCLFQTESTDFNSFNHNKRDIVKEFEISARKYGLRFGIYYSWYEFPSEREEISIKNFTVDYIDTIIDPQIKELLLYKPDIFWFDGDWIIKTKIGKEKVKTICDILKEKNIEINDRVCDPNNGTYRVFSDRYIPENIIKDKWEHINTLSLSWGFMKNNQYKSPKLLLKLYNEVIKKGGNFLLNLSPDKEGIIDVNEQKILKEFGSLINKKQ